MARCEELADNLAEALRLWTATTKWTETHREYIRQQTEEALRAWDERGQSKPEEASSG